MNFKREGEIKIEPVGIDEKKTKESKELLWVAIILELIFLIIFFTGILTQVHVYTGSIGCLLIGFVSLFISVYLLSKKLYSAISLCIMFFSILILCFTFVVYFLPEAGYPPPIRLFF